MFFPMLGFGSVVISDQNRVLLDAHVAFQAAEKVSGQMDRIPLVKGRPQALAQLVDDRLGQQGQGHLTQADVEVQGAGTLPAQMLVETEEFHPLPSDGRGTRRRIVRRPLENSRDWICRTLIRKTKTGQDRKSTRLKSRHLG